MHPGFDPAVYPNDFKSKLASAGFFPRALRFSTCIKTGKIHLRTPMEIIFIERLSSPILGCLIKIDISFFFFFSSTSSAENMKSHNQCLYNTSSVTLYIFRSCTPRWNTIIEWRRRVQYFSKSSDGLPCTLLSCLLHRSRIRRYWVRTQSLKFVKFLSWCTLYTVHSYHAYCMEVESGSKIPHNTAQNIFSTSKAMKSVIAWFNVHGTQLIVRIAI